MFSPCRQGEAVTIEVCFLCSVDMHTKEELQECALRTVQCAYWAKEAHCTQRGSWKDLVYSMHTRRSSLGKLSIFLKLCPKTFAWLVQPSTQGLEAKPRSCGSLLMPSFSKPPPPAHPWLFIGLLLGFDNGNTGDNVYHSGQPWLLIRSEWALVKPLPCSGDELAVNYLATLRYIFRFVAALLYRNSICKFRQYAFVSLYFWTRVPWCSPFSNNRQRKKLHLRGECKKCICGVSVKTAFGADSNRRWRRGALKETSSELHLLCNKPTIFTQLLFKIVQIISKIF